MQETWKTRTWGTGLERRLSSWSKTPSPEPIGAQSWSLRFCSNDSTRQTNLSPPSPCFLAPSQFMFPELRALIRRVVIAAAFVAVVSLHIYTHAYMKCRFLPLRLRVNETVMGIGIWALQKWSARALIRPLWSSRVFVFIFYNYARNR